MKRKRFLSLLMVIVMVLSLAAPVTALAEDETDYAEESAEDTEATVEEAVEEPAPETRETPDPEPVEEVSPEESEDSADPAPEEGPAAEETPAEEESAVEEVFFEDTAEETVELAAEEAANTQANEKTDSSVASYTKNSEICYADDLATAISEADASTTITLLKNVDLSATVEITKNLTIALNGHNITATDARALWVKSGTVTITGTGTVSASATTGSSFEDSSSVIRVGDSDANTSKAALTIDTNVTVSSDHCYGISVFGKNNDSTNDGAGISLTVNGKVEVTGKQCAISGNGSDGLSATSITIDSGAEVSATQDYAIYHPGKGTLSVSGTVSGKGGIEVKSGTVTIDGTAKVTATATTQEHNTNNNGTSTSGYAIAVVGNTAYSGDPTVTINGGTITGTVVKLADNNSNETGTVTATSASISIPVNFQWVGDGTNGYTLTECVAKNGETYYTTLKAAIDAASDGDTIKLIANTNEQNLSLKKNLTLDLNGYTVTGNDTIQFMNVFSVTLTIKDSSEAGTGTIQSGFNNEGAFALFSGSLVLESGIIKNTNGGAPFGGIDSGAIPSLVIKGGCVDTEGSITDTVADFRVTISGGQINASGFEGEMASMLLKTVSPLITGGVFSGSIKTAVEAKIANTNYEVVANVDPETKDDYPWMVRSSDVRTVSVTSKDTDGATGVANLTGGGDIAMNTMTTVAAYGSSYYTFQGWYSGYGTENQKLVSAASTYTFNVGESDVDLVALFVPTPATTTENEQTVTKFNLTVQASSFKYDDVSNENYKDSYTFQLDAGTQYKVTYNGSEKFLYWVNASDNIVSTVGSFTSRLKNNTVLRAVTTPNSADDTTKSVNVVYLNAYDQVISSGKITESSENDSDYTIYEPSYKPSRMGYTFRYWYIEEMVSGYNSEVYCQATSEHIGTYLQESDTQTIHIRPYYEKTTSETYHLVVTLYDNPISKNVVVSSVTISSIDVGVVTTIYSRIFGNNYSGSEFYWAQGNSAPPSDPAILSHSTSFSTVYGKSGTYYVYAFQSISADDLPSVSITQQYTDSETDSNGNTKYKICTTMKTYVPTNYEVVESGFVFGTSTSTFGSLEDTALAEALQIGNAKVYKNLSGMTAKNTTYTFNGSITDPSVKVYIRAFLTYMDGAGNVYTIYTTPILANSYNMLVDSEGTVTTAKAVAAS